MSEYHDTETGEVVSAFYSRSDQINELFAALAKAQAKFAAAEKAGKSNFGKHATLGSVFEATSEGRAENNLALLQMPANGNGNNIVLTTLLGHSSGQWIESRLEMAPAKFDAQGAGSLITYLRRYAAMSILGVAPEDDDGDAAVIQPSAPATRGATRTAQPRPPTSAAAAPPAAPSRTPSSTGNGTPKWIGDFLARESYEIDPQKAGGWSAWEKHYLQVAGCATFEQFARLDDNNRKHAGEFKRAVKPEVFANFRTRCDEISAKYFTDPKFVSQADAAEILQS